jgi:predicted RNase H-like nuclease (RuvC/YqgF family)
MRAYQRIGSSILQMPEGNASGYEAPMSELERYKKRCAELEGQVAKLESENRELRQELESLKTTQMQRQWNRSF